MSSITTPSLTVARAIPLPPESFSSLSPMDLFVSQVSCQDSLETRVDAMKKLSVVAYAIGTDETLGRLIPFVSANIINGGDTGGSSGSSGGGVIEEEDEILLLLAEQLGLLVPNLIPGPSALPLLPLLEKLGGVEETVVRERAVTSMNKIIPMLNPNSADGTEVLFLCAMAKRLSGSDWFTAKVSAAGILPTLYSFIDGTAQNKKAGEAGGEVQTSSSTIGREIRVLYKELSEDDTPMVRRSAARHLGAFAESVAGVSDGKDTTVVQQKISLVMEDVVPIFHALSRDEADSVRLLAVASAGSMGKSLGCDAGLSADQVLPVIRAGCADLSWRVRHNLAKEYAKVASNLGFVSSQGINGTASAHLTEVFYNFSGLLQDAEAEVRGSAVSNVADMTHLQLQVGASGPQSDLFLSHIAPTLQSLATDPVMEVRSRLAQALMDCCDTEKRDHQLADDIILSVFKPLLEGFLNDEFAEVQLHILSKLSRVSHLLSRMEMVVNTILQMSKAPNWRVREAVGHILPHLAEAMEIAFFETHLLEPWLRLLLDQVAHVRIACVSGMPRLLSVAGSTWMQRMIVPHYRQIYDESSSYLTRITILRCYCAVVEEDPTGDVGPELLEEIVTSLLKGLDDRVPNVRMVAVKGIGKAVAHCDEGVVSSKLKPVLDSRATDDDDEDCRHFALIALSLMQQSQ
eukprot:CAMPEP_0194364970 /NCGR_PEP_ID=MMETSP0174-20130528/12917_1 /TAXON_ID=216777 /ORGANISM="Proboscia alata, Strain PI-D3" /LENGTH=686 /DNA_ID=CAMNT_0039139325 /DNA_START=108 /DNA_END=2168 /DNA_ORIENTATION=-